MFMVIKQTDVGQAGYKYQVINKNNNLPMLPERKEKTHHIGNETCQRKLRGKR